MGRWPWARRSHRRAVVSMPPERTRVSSGPAKVTVLMRPVWPCGGAAPRRRVVWAVVTSHRKTARSPPAETKRALSEATARERTSYPWAE